VVKDQHQPRWNEWDDEEPKAPMKEGATPPMSSPQTKQVWKEKVISSPLGIVVWVSIIETRWCTWKVSTLSDLLLSGGL
jgi:hypothetical protein